MKDGMIKQLLTTSLAWLKKCWWILLILILASGVTLSGFKFKSPWFSCEKTDIDIKKVEK